MPRLHARKDGVRLIDTLARMALGVRAKRGSGVLLEGWAEPEPGFVWALGPQSRLTLPSCVRPVGGVVLLELDVNPFVLPGSGAGQRLHISIGGITVGEDRVLGEGTLAYAVPEAAWGGGAAQVALTMPEARRPIDQGFNDDRRRVGFMVRAIALRWVAADPVVPGRVLPPLALPALDGGRALRSALRGLAGLDAAELLGGFESLGHNCEFGMVQRHCGAEPLGLLRFAGITLPDLLRALDAGFEGAGETGQTEVLVAGGVRREFIVRDTRHNFSLHTLRFEDETTAGAVQEESKRQLSFKRRMFNEIVEGGHRLFVFQRPGQTLPAQARPLLARLRARGPNALLFVVEGDVAPPGTVEELGYGFLRGWLDRMAPQEEVGRCNLAAWLSLCANARRLWDVQTASASLPDRSSASRFGPLPETGLR